MLRNMEIEVEKRGLLNERRYHEVLDRLRQLEAVDKGEVSTESIFYLSNRWQLKIQRSTPGRAAKIAWKSGGNDGAESRRELELAISHDNFDAANELMRQVLPGVSVFPTHQRRHDFTLNTVQVALKYSPDWDYHIEIEALVNDESRVPVALEAIQNLADTLGITLLSPEEEQKFVAQRIQERKKRH